jgi:hypothetical protein
MNVKKGPVCGEGQGDRHARSATDGVRPSGKILRKDLRAALKREMENEKAGKKSSAKL